MMSMLSNLLQVLRYEVPLVRSVVKEHFGGASELVVMVVSKSHNLRFTPANVPKGGNAPEQNVSSGMVVEHEVVNPVYPEFFLASSKPFQVCFGRSTFIILFGFRAPPKFLVTSLCAMTQR